MPLQGTLLPQVDLTVPAWGNPSRSPHSSVVQHPGEESSPTCSSLLQALVALHLCWDLHQQPQVPGSATQKSPFSPWLGVNLFPKSMAFGRDCGPLLELQEAEVFAPPEFSSQVNASGETLA